jgi:hypothetical protein
MYGVAQGRRKSFDGYVLSIGALLKQHCRQYE